MWFRLSVLGAALASALLPGTAWAQSAAPPLNAALAEKMATACVTYAKARQAAVNIWIYDTAGGMVHFERMDGAPPVGATVDDRRPGSGMLGGRFDDPAAFSANAPGAVPIVLNGSTIGTARAAGMGAIGDRACARAAAEAAVPASR